MAAALCLSVLAPWAARAGDWPTYRANPARDGYTAEKLPDKLAVRWVYKSRPPRPAWPHVRGWDFQQYDRVYQPVVASGLVFFGSSADDKVFPSAGWCWCRNTAATAGATSSRPGWRWRPRSDRR